MLVQLPQHGRERFARMLIVKGDKSQCREETHPVLWSEHLTQRVDCPKVGASSLHPRPEPLEEGGRTIISGDRPEWLNTGDAFNQLAGGEPVSVDRIGPCLAIEGVFHLRESPP